MSAPITRTRQVWMTLSLTHTPTTTPTTANRPSSSKSISRATPPPASPCSTPGRPRPVRWMSCVHMSVSYICMCVHTDRLAPHTHRSPRPPTQTPTRNTTMTAAVARCFLLAAKNKAPSSSSPPPPTPGAAPDGTRPSLSPFVEVRRACFRVFCICDCRCICMYAPTHPTHIRLTIPQTPTTTTATTGSRARGGSAGQRPQPRATRRAPAPPPFGGRAGGDAPVADVGGCECVCVCLRVGYVVCVCVSVLASEMGPNRTCPHHGSAHRHLLTPPTDTHKHNKPKRR